MKDSSPMKERMKVPAEALEESWVWEALLRLLLGCSFTAGVTGWPAWSMGGGAACSKSSVAGDAKRTKAAYGDGFSFPFLVFPDHAQGRILLAAPSVSS